MKQVEDTLSHMVDRLVEQLPEIDEEIAKLEAELKNWRMVRERVVKTVRLLDPERFPTKAKENGKLPSVSQEKIEEVRRFLRDTPGLKNNFTAAALKREYAGLPSPGVLGAALTHMHANDELVLVGSAQGGAKVYRRVT